MKPGKHHYILLIIFLITLGARLYFSFQAESFVPDAYFTIHKVNNLFEEEIPMLTERLELSNIINFSPLFFYLLVLFKLALGSIAFKLIPHVMIASLVIISYLLAIQITQDQEASLLAAFTTGFIPMVFSKTLYNLSAYTLVLPLSFFIIYSFYRIEEHKRYIYYFIVFLGILRLTHPSVVLLIAAFLLYLVFIKVEGMQFSRAEAEIILFSTLLILWSLFINFKKALLLYGPAIIWQNIPGQILSQYFSDITILDAISLIGIIPFTFGIYIIYKYVFKEKNRKIYLLISFCLVLSLLLWLKLINLETGLMFLGVVLSILSAQFYRMLFKYTEKTKFAKFKHIITFILVIIIALTSAVPSTIIAHSEQQNTIRDAEMRALTWLYENAPKNATVTASLEEGYLITAIARRHNVIDKNFLFIEDAATRLDDVETIYTTLFTTEAIKLMNKYSSNYLYFSERSQRMRGTDQLPYTNDECFNLIFDSTNKIYHLSCKLEER